MSAALELQDLSVTFVRRGRRIEALRSIDLAVGRGEVVVVAGESGSGKSVMARAITGLLPDNVEVAGRVLLDGVELPMHHERTARDIRARRIAFVPQGAASALNPVRRLRGHVRATATYRGLEVGDVEADLAERLGRLGLDWAAVRDRYPHQLSGGMAQRVVTALSLAGGAEVVVADEPTTGLDAAMVDATADALVELTAGAGALVVITHDLRLARRLGGRTALLYASTLVELRDTVAVLDAPRHPYARGLVAALPERGAHPVPGLPPRLDDLPPGCPFAPRCPERESRCDDGLPPFVDVDYGRTRCVLHAAS